MPVWKSVMARQSIPQQQRKQLLEYELLRLNLNQVMINMHSILRRSLEYKSGFEDATRTYFKGMKQEVCQPSEEQLDIFKRSSV